MESNPTPSSEEPKAAESTSMVYSREEYAKKEFWDDRFKESNGQFDWYANWKEIKPVFQKYINYGENISEDEVL